MRRASLVASVLTIASCSDTSSERANWAIELRGQFDQAHIYADGVGNSVLVAEMDCERLLSWPEVGGLNNRGFHELRCKEGETTKVYDLGKPWPHRTPAKELPKSIVEHDYGCPVAASRLMKKMKQCDLETAGITEDLLCGTSSPIDSKVVRMVSNSNSCDELMRYLHIK